MEYGEEYFEGEMKITWGYGRRYSERGRLMNKRTFELFIREKIPRNAKILDVGCAYGYFIKMCQEHHFTAYGLDISSFALKKAKNHGKVVRARGEVLPFKDNSLDVVTLFETLEHAANPYKMLKEYYRVLGNAGFLFIATPNVNSIQALYKKDRWHVFQDETHKYLFTPETLKHIVKKTGFDVMRLETHFYSLPRRLSSFLSKTMLGATVWLVAKKISDATC